MSRHSLNYPFHEFDDCIWPALTWSQRLRLNWYSFKDHLSRFISDGNLMPVEVNLVNHNVISPLSASDMPLIFLTHNDLRFMNSFFKHYRTIGVTRFICVDDQSSDGTFEFLLSQPDVDLFKSNVRYREAKRGRIWREQLLKIYGPNRWYLNVDSDEYFVYENCDIKSLSYFTTLLAQKKIYRCPAPMLDMYPSTSLAEASFDGQNDTMPWEVAPMLDNTGYFIRWKSNGLSIRGGVRSRVFNVPVELIKYPLIFWQPSDSLGISIHFPLPYKYNFSKIFGALLHFKFFSDADKIAQSAIEEGQHYNDAQAYKIVLEELQNKMNSSIVGTNSMRLNHFNDLVNYGFLFSQFDEGKMYQDS